MSSMTRRRFMKALGAGGLAYAIGRTPGTVWADAAGVGGFSDYRALVCVFLFGGNDSWNTVVPRSPAEYSIYAKTRQKLALAQDVLLPISPEGSSPGSFGFHPSMGGMQRMFESGRCAMIANVGPLIEPVTKERYKAKLAKLPPQLFSHNDQQDQWHSLRGRRNVATGWAGRIADLLASDVSGSLPLNVSLSGNSLFQAADRATPYVMGAGGPVGFKGIGSTGRAGVRRGNFLGIASTDYESVYARSFAEVQKRALSYAAVVNSALSKAPALATPFPSNSNLALQLRTVARLIAVRESLGLSRQIFFVAAGGFDTHSSHMIDQPLLLGDVSSSIAAFYDAMVELGVDSDVTTFTQSDFARTLTSNGDGSDHAWGGVQFVVGGSVLGRRIYGEYPVLENDSPIDVGGGRFIPGISSDQYSATLARWFGVRDDQLATIAPSLGNFARHDLGFLV